VRRLLVDTSVWVNHFRIRDEVLADALALDLVMMHPMVLGELVRISDHRDRPFRHHDRRIRERDRSFR